MGSLLSGGEQQMLAVGRALMTNPRLLILDEATEGLAPLIRAEIWRCLGRLKAEGLALLVIDKNVAGADPPRRPPLPDRARPRGVDRHLGRTRRGAGHPAPLFGGLRQVLGFHILTKPLLVRAIAPHRHSVAACKMTPCERMTRP